MDSTTTSNVNKLNRKTDNYNNLDHLYCNTNESNHIRATNTGATGVDNNNMGTIRKEITQLKAMLLLHLDLIQEQSDQLMSKDKLLANLRQENDMLKMKIERMDRRSKLNNNNKKQQHQQKNDDTTTTTTTQTTTTTIKPTTTVSSFAEISANCELPEIKNKCDIDILKKISTKILNNCSLKLNSLSELVEDQKYRVCSSIDNAIDKSIAKSLNEITNDTKAPTIIINPTTTTTAAAATTTTTDNQVYSTIKSFSIIDNEIHSIDTIIKPLDVNNSIIGESNGKLISKIILQRVQKACGIDDQQGGTTIVIKNEIDTNSVPKEILAAESVKIEDDENLDNSPFASITSTTTKQSSSAEIINDDDTIISQISTTPIDTSPMAINMPLQTLSSQPNSDDFINEQTSISPSTNYHHSHSTGPDEFRKRTHTVSMTSSNTMDNDYRYTQSTSPPSTIKRNYIRGHKVITTKDQFPSREWRMDEMADEVNRQIAETGEDRPVQENINLEIPRWIVKDCPGLYSIEGTEDLSDEVFLKRHTRLEQHERKRKKWDVQRIREQRTIERLKRRHCKDELLEQKDLDYSPSSFYPSASNVKFLQYTDELPVAAFGEIIPLLHKVNFTLPWLQPRSLYTTKSTTNATTTMTNSNFYQYQNVADKCLTSNNEHTSIVFVAKKKINRRHFVGSGNISSSLANQTSPIKSRAIRRRARR